MSAILVVLVPLAHPWSAPYGEVQGYKYPMQKLSQITQEGITAARRIEEEQTLSWLGVLASNYVRAVSILLEEQDEERADSTSIPPSERKYDDVKRISDLVADHIKYELELSKCYGDYNAREVAETQHVLERAAHLFICIADII